MLCNYSNSYCGEHQTQVPDHIKVIPFFFSLSSSSFRLLFLQIFQPDFSRSPILPSLASLSARPSTPKQRPAAEQLLADGHLLLSALQRYLAQAARPVGTQEAPPHLGTFYSGGLDTSQSRPTKAGKASAKDQLTSVDGMMVSCQV